MEISTQIGTVTVYPDRALVTRTGKAELTGGAEELIVAGLPSQLDTASLRASGRGEVAVAIIGVEARQRTLTQPGNATARGVKAEYEAAQDAASALTATMARLDGRAVTIQELALKAAQRLAYTLAQGTTRTANATHLLDYVADQLKQIDAERAALEKQKRANDALQTSLADRLEQLQNGGKAQENVVAVLIEAAGAGAWELELSYLVSGARWTPIYDARVATGERAKFVLSLKALVTQQSGENWENVAMKLSTARPGLGSLPPKLDPIWISEPQHIAYERAPLPAPMMLRSRVAPSDAQSTDADEDMLSEMSAPAPIEAEDVVADIESTGAGATVEFALPRALSVPGDGQNHRVAIATREFPAKFDYLAIPRRVEVAYLRAKATNNSSLALLAGEISIFRDGVFVGKAGLKNTAPGGEFELFLGPDEQVRAKRAMTTRETDKNFIGNARRIHFAYEIELNNLKAHAVEVAVQDQIPVSRSENIKIKLRGAQPEATQSDLGLLDWTVELGAGEKRTLRFDYGVESARDTAVVGLVD